MQIRAGLGGSAARVPTPPRDGDVILVGGPENGINTCVVRSILDLGRVIFFSLNTSIPDTDRSLLYVLRISNLSALMVTYWTTLVIATPSIGS